MKYRMPAEWEPHTGTWLAWPHNREHWPGEFKPIPLTYSKIVYELARSENVFICVNDEAAQAEARKVLAENKPRLRDQTMQKHFEEVCAHNIHFYHISTDASWARDHGPIFVKDDAGKLVITDWIYNAWGGKYAPWNFDDVVPRRIAEIFNLPVLKPGIVLEGGSIDVNGKGVLLTTEQCLLNKNRNPELSREQIEKYLEDYLGAKHVLWLKEGIIGDDTDGHIDDIARFTDENTIVCAVEENPKDENYEILQKNFEDLSSMKNIDGKPFKIVKIPMPSPVVYDRQRLPASYANFYIANKAVLVPTFNCAEDEKVLEIFNALFPTRLVVPIDCVDLVWGLGTIHCSTQQQPA